MTNINSFVFDKYTDILTNSNKYSDSEIDDFYIKLNNIIDNYTSNLLCQGTYLVLTIMTNFDKNMNNNENKSIMTEKVITNFATWYNINYKSDYMIVINNIICGFRNFMMFKKGNICDYMPKEIFVYNKEYKINNNLVYSLSLTSILILLYCSTSFVNYDYLLNITDLFSNSHTTDLFSNLIITTKNIIYNISY